MSDDSTRRSFLKWLGVGAGSAALGGLTAGCSEPSDDNGTLTDAGSKDSSDPSDTAPSDTGDTGPSDAMECEAPDGDAGAPPDAGSCEQTASDLEGPFHAEGAPQRSKLAPDDEPGTRIIIEGTVYESDCVTPIPCAMLDVWHANDQGDYYDASDNYRLRGQLQTGSDGTFEIHTIRPGRYPDLGGLRPRHVHFIISSPPHGSLTTQMYFQGDSQLEDDSCDVCSSDEESLIVDFQTETRGGSEVLVGTFDIIFS